MSAGRRQAARGRARGLGLAVAVAVAATLAGLASRREEPSPSLGAWLREAGLSERYEQVVGVRVRYVRAGGGPAVVLVHGFASSIYTWKDAIPGLARSHDVVALDLPGFGGSEAPPDLSFELLLGVLPGLMDRLGLGKASLVGSSLGGAIATLVAAAHPERVERLVLVDAAGFNLAPGEAPFLVRLSGSGVSALFERLPVRRPLVRAALRQVFHDRTRVTDERVEEYLAPLLRPGAPAATRSLLRSRRAFAGSFAEAAAKVRAPTLILWGREDRWIPVEHADRFAAAVPGSRKVVLEGCGHLPQEERPAETLRLLESFLAEG